MGQIGVSLYEIKVNSTEQEPEMHEKITKLFQELLDLLVDLQKELE